MTAIDYKALAERLEAHAECHANVEPYDDEQRQWAADLRTVVSLLEGMAAEKPVAWLHRLHFPDGTSDDILSFGEGVPDDFGEGELVEVSYPLYLHPAPQPQPEQTLAPTMPTHDPAMGVSLYQDGEQPERQPVSEPTEAQIEAAMLTIRAELGVGFLSYSTEKNLAGAVLRAALAAEESK